MTDRREAVSVNLARMLRVLYDESAKHGTYHPPPLFLKPYFPHVNFVANWRDPTPRIKLLESRIRALPQREGVTFVELGSNTGGQLLELSRLFPSHSFIGLELNTKHASFTREVARIAELRNVEVLEGSFSPERAAQIWPGAVFLDFNVAHHLGVDFEFAGVRDSSSWRERGLAKWLEPVAKFSEYWFSVGYRLGGDKRRELHPPHDPEGFIHLVKSQLPDREEFDVVIYFAEKMGEELEFVELTRSQVGEVNRDRKERASRLEFIGEYFARPIFRFSEA